MKDKKTIILASVLAVLICLITTTLLFYAVTPKFLVILSFTIGIVTGACITSIIIYLINTFRDKRLNNEK
jgi:MFS family permease